MDRLPPRLGCARFRRWLACGVICLSLWRSARAGGAEPQQWLTGTALHKALDQPVTLVQERTPVRELLRKLSEVRQTACWLDRRIDPSTPVTLPPQPAPLREVFDEVARQVGARCVLVGGTLCLGREADLDRIATQAEALQMLTKTDRNLPAARRVQLAREQSFAWQDLDRPIDVLGKISQQWSFSISNPELVPHDLWAGGTASGVDATQALSLVLGQFDLSFRWLPGGTIVEVIPLPERVAVERLHRPQRMSLSEAAQAIHTQWPGVPAAPRGAGLAVEASVLEHAAISERLGEVRTTKPIATPSAPLDRRRFPNVRIVRKPISAVLASLAAQGVVVEYDAAQLGAAGIDLETLVSLEFNDATVDEFFTALCAPVGLHYTIDGPRVILRPK